VAFSPSGTLLATAGADRTVRLWQMPALTPVRTLAGHAELVYGVAFSPDGSRLASASADQTARVWAPLTGDSLLAIPYATQVYGVRFTPDGKALATLPMDGTVRLLEGPAYH
jgi:WD40 repeat protein